MKIDVHFNLYQETGYSQQRYNAVAIHLRGPLSPLRRQDRLPSFRTCRRHTAARTECSSSAIHSASSVQWRMTCNCRLGIVYSHPLSAFVKCVSVRLVVPPRLVWRTAAAHPSRIARLVRVAVELGLHPNSTNRKDGPILSGSWKTLIRSFEGRRRVPRLVCMLTLFLPVTKLCYTASASF